MSDKIVDTSEKLKAYLKELAKKLETGNKLRLGFLEGATETRGGVVVSIPMIAAIQNFGAPAVGIPPRPFFDNFVKDYQDGWGPALAENLKLYDYDAAKALHAMGEGMKPQLQQSIVDMNSPELSEVTLLLRQMRSEGGPDFVVTGATVAEARQRVADGERAGNVNRKALMDSRQMFEAVDFEVVP